MFIQVRDGVPTDAMLSDNTKDYLGEASRICKSSTEEFQSNEKTGSLEKQDDWLLTKNDAFGNGAVQQVEVPLTFDAEFFSSIQGDLWNLDIIHADEQKTMIEEISGLGEEVARLSHPRNKTDLYSWRELFDIYLQAGVFFSTNESDRGSRISTSALTQLQWFQHEIVKRNIPKTFKSAASRQALDRFAAINLKLLRSLKFQEINQLAISKILKSTLLLTPTMLVCNYDEARLSL